MSILLTNERGIYKMVTGRGKKAGIFLFGLIFLSFLLLIAGCNGESKSNSGLDDATLKALLQSQAPSEADIFKQIASEEGTLPPDVVEAQAEALSLTVHAAEQVPGYTDNDEIVYFWVSQLDTVVDLPDQNGIIRGDIVYAFVYMELPDHPLLKGQVTFHYRWMENTSIGNYWKETGHTVNKAIDVSGSISGSVLNEITEEPISRAKVYAKNDDGTLSLIAVTSTSGSFEVSAVKPGTVKVYAFADEFQISEVPGVSVSAGQTTSLPNPIKLIPIVDMNSFATIRGKVYFRDGITPIYRIAIQEKVEKTLVYVTGSNGQQASGGLTTYTDQNGEYQISFLPPGDYQLRVRMQELSQIKSFGTQAYDPAIAWVPITITSEMALGTQVIDLPDIRMDNMPPVLNSINLQKEDVNPGESITINADSFDPDNDILSYYWSVSAGTLSLSISNTVEWTAPDDVGTPNICLTVSDKKGAISYQCVPINVGWIKILWENEICFGGGNSYCSDFDMIADDFGGAFFGYSAWHPWESNRTSINVQRRNNNGDLLWDVLLGYAPYQMDELFRLVSDGAGGIIAVWSETNAIFASRIDLSGNVLWKSGWITAGGTPAWYLSKINAISDGSGGAIVFWIDGSGPFDFLAQRIDVNGNLLWSPGGVNVSTSSIRQDLRQYDSIASDMSGGAIITWTDENGGYIYANRVDGYGNIAWQPNGIPICTESHTHYSPVITSDNLGGAIISWIDTRNEISSDIFAQRVDSLGNIQWTLDGIEIMDNNFNSVLLQTQNYQNGVIYLSGSLFQGVDENGNLLRNSRRSVIDGNENDIVRDNMGGYLISYNKGGDSYGPDLYLQLIDGDGNDLWGVGGALLSSQPWGQDNSKIIITGPDEAIIIWRDFSQAGTMASSSAAKVRFLNY
ncbi:MAG: carboxypeptidase regulatory-like domain-containing protein [bacterium]|nr:carboxypeptidase regulatory-like domain-containing protein [bacterium]